METRFACWSEEPYGLQPIRYVPMTDYRESTRKPREDLMSSEAVPMGGGEPREDWYTGRRHKQPKSYLIAPAYRKTDLLTLMAMSDSEIHAHFVEVRWGNLGKDTQCCPKCGAVATHYWLPRLNRWKCREAQCHSQFTVFSGTRLHGTKLSAREILSIAVHFMEAKDSISAREIAGLHGLNYHSAHALLLKIREAIEDTMRSEPPLSGRIQVDAAYFCKYVRPGNIGTGGSAALQQAERDAELPENLEKGAVTRSKNKHAIVVFVEMGEQGRRRYKVAKVKTESQVRFNEIAVDYCLPSAVITSDQHGAYAAIPALFDGHHAVNHQHQFVDDEGNNTNLAENFFSRMRHANRGAWHRVSLQHLESYAWEIAWRQSMVSYSNDVQLRDLLARILMSGRTTRFKNFRGTGEKRPPRDPEESGQVREIPKDQLPRKRGRPKKGSVLTTPPGGSAVSTGGEVRGHVASAIPEAGATGDGSASN